MKIRDKMGAGLVMSAVLAAVTTTAWGQVRQVQLNNPMDANPQVGAGGANHPVPGYVPVNGNEVMTGNVSGLGAWHGQVGRPGNQSGLGVFSPYQSQALTGSSSFNNFARLTAGSNTTGLGQVYYQPQATFSTAQGGLYAAPTGSGFDSALVPRQAVSSLATPGQLLTLAPEGNASGRVQGFDRSLSAAVTPGAPGAVLDSPLFGPRIAEMAAQEEAQKRASDIRQGSVLPSTDTTGAKESIIAPTTNPAQVEAGLTGVNASDRSELKGTNAAPKPVEMQVSESYKNLTEELRQAQGAGAEFDLNNPDLGPSGRSTEIDPLTGRPRQIRMSDRTGAGGMGTGAESGTGAAREGRGTANAGRGAGGAAGSATSQPGGGVTGPRGATGGPAGAGTGGLKEPTKPNLTAKRLEDLSTDVLTAGGKIKPVRLASGDSGTAGLGTGAAAGGTGAAGARGTGSVGGNALVTTFDVMMSRGGDNLKNGKYLDAMQSYQAAMALKPADPLPLVGRAHAELAAGMYSTAAYDLKFVYTRKPELVSVKYDPISFIPPARQEYLLSDLQKLSAAKETADLASFLYSYICYQSGRTPQLQSELRTWGARDGHDDWQGVVSKAWGGAPATK